MGKGYRRQDAERGTETKLNGLSLKRQLVLFRALLDPTKDKRKAGCSALRFLGGIEEVKIVRTAMNLHGLGISFDRIHRITVYIRSGC
jgi:hypothetical protein